MQHPTWLSLPRTAIAIAVAVVAAAPALAQNTTSGINGTVTGADGKPVAGATVTIVHVESGSTSTVSTDDAGRYSARGLRAGGPYTVTISTGAQSDRREGLFLNLAESLPLDAQIGTSTQVITVTGRGASDRFNRNAMGAGTTIGSRELTSLASLQRNLQDYARTDPRLAQTDKGGGAISAAGQNNRYNSITIDGVAINDTFGLESNNLPTRKQPISIDAIQSVQVNISNYDITQKGYTGANINAVTKSGTNDFSGSVYYVTRDANLVGKAYNYATGVYSDFADFKENTKGFTVGGPIIRDRLFFFGGYEELVSSKARPTFGPLGSNLTNVGIQPSAITSAIGIARDTWGMDVGQLAVPSTLELKVKDTLLKLDWNISDNHRANVRYNKTQQSDPIITTLFSPTLLSLSSWWYTTDKTIETLVGQWFADWTPSLSTEFKVSQRDYSQRHIQVNGTRLPAVSLTFAGALPQGTTGVNANPRTLSFGTEASRHFNVLDTKTSDLYLGANWQLGAHELKFGADYANNEIFNAFLQNTQGTYTFNCQNSSATITYSFGAINCQTATADQVQAAVLENFQLGRPSSYTVQLPRNGRVLPDGAANWSFANTGLFLQDTWRVSQAFNVMLGLRVDQQNVPEKPLYNAAAAAPRVAGSVNGTTVTRDTGGFGVDNTVTLDGNTLVQPRVGFNWNLPGTELRTQIRGGFGLFQGAAANVWLSNPFSNTGAAVVQFNCASITACQTANAAFSPNPNAQPALTGVPPAANLDIISPSLEQPSVWKANLAFEVETPRLPVVGSLILGAEWLHTETKTGVYYQHLNLGDPTRTGPDGRQMFYRPEGYNPACFNGDGSPITTGATCATPTNQTRTRALSNRDFANVYLARETGKGYGDSITFSVTRPATQGLSWGAAYTYTTAKEVSPLTASTSNSNWLQRNIYNPNEETLQNSNYLIRDRFTANMSWSKAFVGRYRTTLGVFYEGRRGKPYSWTYINDLNGDGVTGNDLMYIPSAPGSGEVEFRGRNANETPAQAEAAFWEVVNGNPELSAARGGVVGRNTSFAPWVNSFDMRFSQELPGFMSKHTATFTLDILNFGNLLNKKWGHIDEIDFPSRRRFVNYAGVNAQGKYIYSMGSVDPLITQQGERQSQWAIQATLRYSF